MVERSQAEHFEILRTVRRWCARIRPVECVGHAHAFDRFLGDAIHHNRGRDAGGLKECRYDVDYVVELVADAALVLDSGRPGNGHALTRAAKVSCDLLRPLERRVERPGPPTAMWLYVLSVPQAS